MNISMPSGRPQTTRFSVRSVKSIFERPVGGEGSLDCEK